MAAIFIAFAALLVVTSRIVAGDGETPPPPGDTQDYDNIAVQLLHGRGFAIDYSDPEWRRPYQQHNPEGDFDEVMSRKGTLQVTTYRPPLLPFALAITYRLFGRNFLAWRIIESVLTALGIALICDVAWRAFGPRVALISAGLMFVSATYIHYVVYWAYMTEPLAIFLIGVVVWAISRITSVSATRMAALCGIAFALLCLTRSFYIVWLPFIAVLVWRFGKAKAAFLFVILGIALQMPWWIRNIRVTGALMPFGTQAGVAMHTAYSDLAVLHHGRWWWAKPNEYENAYVRELGRPCKGCTEVQLARDGVRGGRIWAMQHMGELPKLAWWKLENTWNLVSDTGFIAPLFWLVLASPLVLWRRRNAIATPIVIAIAVLLALNFAVIAMTWSMGWRFLAPVEPLLTVLVAVPLASVLFGESAVHAEDGARP